MSFSIYYKLFLEILIYMFFLKTRHYFVLLQRKLLWVLQKEEILNLVLVFCQSDF